MSNIINHKHLEFANHSPNQQRMFFALAQQLGHNAIDIKENAKKKFNVDCFQKLTTSDMIFLIDRLVSQEKKRQQMGWVPKKTAETPPPLDTKPTGKVYHNGEGEALPWEKRPADAATRKEQAEKANQKMMENL